MYLLFREKGWKPSEVAELEFGEKRVIHAFFMKQKEEEIREE